MGLDQNIELIKENIRIARINYDKILSEITVLRAEMIRLKSEGGLYSRIGHMPGLKEAKVWRDDDNNWRMSATFPDKAVDLRYGKELPTADVVYDDATTQLKEAKLERNENK